MSAIEDGLAARAAWARDVALFRYGMIRAAADPDLSRSSGEHWCARWRPVSTRAPAGGRCGRAGPPSTGGSGTGGPAGSTR